MCFFLVFVVLFFRVYELHYAMKGSYHSIYAHGLVRVAVGIPKVIVADPAFNGDHTLALVQQASTVGAAVVLFPELGVSAYSNEDLFHQAALLAAVLPNLGRIVGASVSMSPVIFVGAP